MGKSNDVIKVECFHALSLYGRESGGGVHHLCSKGVHWMGKSLMDVLICIWHSLSSGKWFLI